MIYKILTESCTWGEEVLHCPPGTIRHLAKFPAPSGTYSSTIVVCPSLASSCPREKGRARYVHCDVTLQTHYFVLR